MKRAEPLYLRVDTDDMHDVSAELRMSVYWTWSRFDCATAVEGVVSGEGQQ